ncbi:MAG: hypothetical protein M1814_006474 [Vezdaea aestivalis]|nr:MAG: hypothetical protein M1814_006474 [Vezdaea aestivalis]
MIVSHEPGSGPDRIRSRLAMMSMRKKLCFGLAIMIISTILLLSNLERPHVGPSVKKAEPSSTITGHHFVDQKKQELLLQDDEKNKKQDLPQVKPGDDAPFWESFQPQDTLFGGLYNLHQVDVNDSLAAAYLIEDPRQPATGADTHPQAKIYNPYPDYTSQEWKKEWRAEYRPCIGPRGVELDSSLDDMVMAYSGIPSGFPAPSFGSFEVVGLDNNVCFDRYSRLGAYGYGEDDYESAIPGWKKPKRVSWNDTKWGHLQNMCTERNKDRFDFSPRNNTVHIRPDKTLEKDPDRDEKVEMRSATAAPKPRKRTAILLRTWTGYEYTPNVMRQLRSMIVELSLQTGGEYSVFLMVHVKDDTIPIYSDDALYEAVKRKYIPQEFWDISILWNENMNRPWYPLLKDHTTVHDSQWMPLQRFSRDHPEFDFYWNWEIDTRYIGHHFHFTDQMAEWARRQPRRGLWERNERFYIPRLHGDFDTQFRTAVEHSVNHQVWGPVKTEDVNAMGPKPPVYFPQRDNYEWGVGEEADYIALLPIFDPEDTTWIMNEFVWNYKSGLSTNRRGTIICQARVSKRLLDIMHEENLAGHHMASEMWPQSVALHHGLKAVYAPHPIFQDRAWPTDALSQIYNPGPRGVSGSHPLSLFGFGREEPFRGFTWYYHAKLPAHLYRAWMGWRDGGKGGEEWEADNGRMCLPGMLLHPIKDIVTA